MCTYVYSITEKTEMEKYFQLVWTKVTLSKKVWNTYNVISDDEAKEKSRQSSGYIFYVSTAYTLNQ
jgi:hypothetical protein